jgi:DNA-binding SARP family transcriptional activator
MRSLVRLALLRAAVNRGDLDAGRTLVDAILDDPASPDLVLRLARSTEVLHLQKSPPLPEAAEVLSSLAGLCSARSLPYFAGISLHNSMEVSLAAGRYKHAYDLGERALDKFAESGQRRSIASAHATLAICAAELGRSDLMREHLGIALRPKDEIGPDCAVTSSYLMTILGEDERAAELLGIAEGHIRGRSVDAAVMTWYRLATARRAVALGDHVAALAALAPPPADWAVGPGARAAALTLRAMALLQQGDQEGACDAADDGLAEAASSGALSWDVRLAVVRAIAQRNEAATRQAVARAARLGALAVLDVAEPIAELLDVLTPLPPDVMQSITDHPTRWRLILRRQMDRGPSLAAYAAATLLDEIGTADDIPVLRAYERAYLRSRRGIRLGRKLAERASPSLIVHDLGRASFEIGSRSVDLGAIRRRAASLLTYLIARPRQIATRERVLDDLWPELAPAAAANSLNQTLYFLRRDIDPWYEDAASIEYIQFRGETLALTPGLVHVESVEFHRSAVELLSRKDVTPDELTACQSRYRGHFAPEFEYEDWSTDWRNLLHTTYLHLVSHLQKALVQLGDLQSAIGVTQVALAIDPRSPELHECLVWLLGASGYRAAAAEQYSRYASVVEEELGAPAQSFGELVGAPFPPS